jgi:hypothetical protein
VDRTGRYSSRYYRHCTIFSEALKANFLEPCKADIHLPRIPIPRTPVNKGKRKGRGRCSNPRPSPRCRYPLGGRTAGVVLRLLTCT